jgi:hypothetical protein
MDANEGDNAKGGHGRPLGRGLEDVSHLFLSPRARDVPSAAGPDASAVLRPTQVTRDQLAALLPLDWSGVLEDGLRTIGTKIPCPPCGEIDVLAVDRTGKLTIVDFDTTASDNLLLRGLGHVDWLARNVPLVQRLCPGQAFDTSLTPRMILLAPHFSPVLRRVMRPLSRQPVQWVRYHAVETSAGPAILLEPVAGD